VAVGNPYTVGKLYTAGELYIAWRAAWQLASGVTVGKRCVGKLGRSLAFDQSVPDKIEIHAMRCTPIRFTPMRCTPIRFTPMRFTPMKVFART